MSHANCVPKTMSFTEQGSITIAIKRYMHPQVLGKKNGVNFGEGQAEERGSQTLHSLSCTVKKTGAVVVLKPGCTLKSPGEF